MALYHMTAKIISRSKGRSSVAAAAYRSRSIIIDDRQGLTFDYSHKRDLAFSEIILPENAPERFNDRETLWNEVENKERRRDAQLAREIEVALPSELNLSQQIELTREYIKDNFTSKGMIADYSIHHLKNNPHAHIMLTTREVSRDGFKGKVRDWNNKKYLLDWRKKWADKTNEKLLSAGYDTRIDHRNFREIGIDLIPQKHVGYNLKFLPKSYLDLHYIDKNNVVELASIKHQNGEKILADPEKAFRFLTHQNVAFSEKNIDVFLETHTLGDQFNDAKKLVMASDQLVKIGKDESGNDLFTTSEMIQKEKDMLDKTEQLFLSDKHHISDKISDQTLINYSLTPDQKRAYQSIVEGGDITLVMGAAGTGKSYTLAAVCEAFEAGGYNVKGVALSGIAAENLEQSSGIKSTTIFSQLRNWDNDKERLTSKDILVVDEVGFVGTRQMHQILSEANHAGAKVIGVGDIEQLPAIEAGGAARGMMNRIGFSELEQIRRQNQEWQKEATTLMASPEKHMGEAIDLYNQHGKIKAAETRFEAMGKLIADWKDYAGTEPNKKAVILAYSNNDVSMLNDMARDGAKEGGRIGKQEFLIETQKKERTFKKFYAKGDRILFLENNRSINIKNGSLGTIEKIVDTPQDHSMRVKLDTGAEIAFDYKEYNKFDHGYAMTVHKSQGATVDRSFVLATQHFNKHAAYVSMSRHRDDATLYFGKNEFRDIDHLKDAMEQRRLKSLVLDFADYRGFEITEQKQQDFKKVNIAEKEYKIPHGDLVEPIKGTYFGDVDLQGNKYHRIEKGKDERFLIPEVKGGVNQSLRLRTVEYDGKTVKKEIAKVSVKAKEKDLDDGREMSR